MTEEKKPTRKKILASKQMGQIMADYFKRVGLKTVVSYSHEGHSFGNWRRATVNALKYFFGR